MEKIHSQCSKESDAVTNGSEMDSNSSHNPDDNSEKLIELEIDLLASDTISDQNEDENIESLTEFLTSDNESMPETRNNCIETRTISEQSAKTAPKQQIKIMKMDTIEQIV